MDRTIIFAIAILWTCGLLQGQQAPYAFYEEIQDVPQKMHGEWSIGGYKFVANEVTRIDQNFPADIGVLAEVEFYVKNGVKIATAIRAQSARANDVTDGPYVFWRNETTAEVITLAKGKKHSKIYTGITEPRQIQNLPGLISAITLDPKKPLPAKSEWSAPPRLLALSDLEGNYKNTLEFLKANQVIDENGNWRWGDGHLVLVGDLVDRGDQVIELMWLIRRLERQAESAGGQVHYVLGNHEAMVMAADIRYIHAKYRFVTGRLEIRYHDLFSPDSDIGRWWRSKNGVLRIGELLFVHGGYSPLLDQANLSIDELNQRIRQGLHPARPSGSTAATNPVGHIHGPFWYRGYFDKHAAEWGGKASDEEIDRILHRHNARHIVIGHTLVDQVGPLDEAGRVIAIDVQWQEPNEGQGLLLENGELWRVKQSGVRQRLEFGSQN